MATLKKCPHCGADIENDSYFCDQCGAELSICPKCGNFTKAKFCTSCGVQSVKASEYAAGLANTVAPNQPQQPVQPSQPVQPQQSIPSQQPVQPPQSQAGVYVPRPTTDPMSRHSGTIVAGNNGLGGMPAGPSRLSSHALGIVLPLQAGAVIGRVFGNYVSQLSTLNFISGTHARLDYGDMGWTITDLGSTNGTTVNGLPCAPTQPLHVGDVVRIGKTYDFYVE